MRIYQGSVLLPFCFAVLVDVRKFASGGALSGLLYANDLVLMGGTIEGLRNNFLECREAIESEGLNANLGKTKVSGGISKDGLSKCKFDLCGACNLRVRDNSVLCMQCSKWIHSRCSFVKKVTPKFSIYFKCKECELNIGETVEQVKK